MKNIKKAMLCILVIPLSLTAFTQKKESNLPLFTYAGDKVEKIQIGKTYKIKIDTILNLTEPWVYIKEVKAYKLEVIDYQTGYYQFTFSELTTTLDTLERIFDNVSINEKLVPLYVSGNNLETKYAIEAQLINPFHRSGLPRGAWILITFIITFGLIFIYFIRSNFIILRDQGTQQKRAPFSLSRTQMAFWTIVVLLSYFIIWWKTGEAIAITPQVLVLLGISAGTATLGHIMDSDDITNPKITKRHQDTDSRKGFMQNLISDGYGLSIHRLQNVLFTLAIGLYFLYEVWYFYSIPDLNSNLVILMGISSSTYLAIKKGENKMFQDTPVS